MFFCLPLLHQFTVALASVKHVFAESLQLIVYKSLNVHALSITLLWVALLYSLKLLLVQQAEMGWDEGVRAQRPPMTNAVVGRLLCGVLGDQGFRDEVGPTSLLKCVHQCCRNSLNLVLADDFAATISCSCVLMPNICKTHA